MFAIFLTKGMDPFYQNISSFPTVFFTFFLAVIVLYWVVAVLGFVDIEVLDFDGPELEIDLDLDLDGADAVEMGSSNVLAGLMLRLGLTGVPVTIILSFIALFGWLICYYSVHFLFPLVPDGWLQLIAGVPVLVVSLYAAALLTAQVIKPLRPLFNKAQQETVKHILGQVAIVRTLRVDNRFGEASLADGGAGLILKVRTRGDATYAKGDRVVLFEHDREAGFYYVISEAEFAAPV